MFAGVVVSTVVALGAAALCPPARAAEARELELVYEVALGPLSPERGAELYIPLPVDDEVQVLRALRVDGDVPGRVEVEERFGNRYWRGQLGAGDWAGGRVRITARVSRRAAGVDGGGISAAERALFMEPSARVPTRGDFLEPLLADLDRGDGSPRARARGAYELVLETMEYKKVGEGWGRGDTEWACSARYGNCTDFHALLSSLARAEGIPARFEIGLPIPEGSAAGEVGGYHCWLSLYLDGEGWLPVDASEAWKHPERRDALFGSLEADRIALSVGRDLDLGQAGPALSFFVWPYLEVDGLPVGLPAPAVSWREIEP